jgi:hypothetical protein
VKRRAAIGRGSSLLGVGVSAGGSGEVVVLSPMRGSRGGASGDTPATRHRRASGGKDLKVAADCLSVAIGWKPLGYMGFRLVYSVSLLHSGL